RAAQLCGPDRLRVAGEVRRFRTSDVSQATLASVAPVFTVTKFDKQGNVTSFERKKTELYQELETDIKIFKESILEILDEEELLEELCVSKWSDPQVFEKSSAGIDHAEEMELLLENYYRLADDLSNAARELRVLIDDSQSIIFINLDSHRNVMMRLNLQLTMGTFSLSLFGLMGVAFGMNL
ncbi:MRS2 isoform 6, partial [Pan troglodytes]